MFSQASAYPAWNAVATAGMLQPGTVQNALPGMLRRPMPATHDGFTVALKYDAWNRFFGTRVKRRLVPAFIVWLPLNHDRSFTKFWVGVCRVSVNVLVSPKPSNGEMNRKIT